MVVLFDVVLPQRLLTPWMIGLCPVAKSQVYQLAQIRDIVKVGVEVSEDRSRKLAIESDDVANRVIHRCYPFIGVPLRENEFHVWVLEVRIDEVGSYETPHLDHTLISC